MGLISCPDCKKEISDSAQSCPHCGSPIDKGKPNLPQKKKKSKAKTILIITFAIFGFIIIMNAALKSTKTPEERAQNEASQQQTRENRMAEQEAKRQAKIDQATKITPSKLFREFKANEIAANQKYNNKPVLMTAKISEITESITGKPEIAFFVDSYGIERITCTFPRDARDQIAQLRKGQQITLYGVVSVFVLGSHLSIDKCDLVEYWQ